MVKRDDPDPEVISCCGPFMPEIEEEWLRFVEDCPVSSVT